MARRVRLTEVVLVALFLLSLAYLGRVGWSMRPTPPPSPTPTPTPTVTPTPTPAVPPFDGQRAYQHVVAQVELGPRVPGSEASARARAYFRRHLEAAGWEVEEEAFTYRGTRLVNLVARRGSGPVVILGAHYDSRPRADRDQDPARRQDPVPGANDGASGAAVLLELPRVLRWDEARVAVWLYFFDGEDSGNIDDWTWAVGASHAAASLPPDRKVEAMVLLDMVGDADQQFYWEGNSDPNLRAALWDTGGQLGYRSVFVPEVKYTIMDDHVPFVRRGIPAVDIIDFDYAYWHTTADTADKVSAESLARVGRVVALWLEATYGP